MKLVNSCTEPFLVPSAKGIVPVLFLTQHHAKKAYWGSGGITPHIL
jgi:hypothetical protein